MKGKRFLPYIMRKETRGVMLNISPFWERRAAKTIRLLQTVRLIQALSSNNGQLLEAIAQLQATNAGLTALDQLKDQFISVTLHELETPITVVLEYIELLCKWEDELSSEQQIAPGGE
jgi:signal transduction histidine kinase